VKGLLVRVTRDEGLAGAAGLKTEPLIIAWDVNADYLGFYLVSSSVALLICPTEDMQG
jgi:hypothetical protein